MDDKLIPRIAIAGAGAMGVMTGYHLAAAGAEITYLFRPARAVAMPAQYRLCSYNDGSTKVFDGFGVIADPAELSKIAHDFVVVTLDGAALTSADGCKLLSGIGKAVRDRSTVLIIGSVGIGLREFAVEASWLGEGRVTSGMLGLLCHQTAGVSLPLHSPTDPDALATADFAFRYLNEAAFVLEGRNGEAAARFAAIFDQSGLAGCTVLASDELALQSRAIFPILAAGDILGWTAADVFTADPLWLEVVEATRAIQGLAEHGQAGRTAAAGLLEGCIARGQSEGRDRSAVRRIADRFGAQSA